MRARWGLVLLGLLAGPAPADELGRLFFTQAERARLDAERSAPSPADVDAKGEPPPSVATPREPALAALPSLTVNGLVLRAHGPSTAWINGTPGTRRELATARGLEAGRELRIGRDAVEIEESHARARVKPGQTFEPLAGRVVESFESAPAAVDAP